VKTVALHTLGCKLNYAETSTISRLFEENQYQITPFEEAADVYVINTCSVTHNADKECKRIVNQVKRRNEHSLVCIIGCYAQLKSQEIASIEGVDIVLGSSEKFNLIKFVNEHQQGRKQVHSCEIDDVKEFIGSYSLGSRTRAFLKVQDGCDYTCTYCTIPLARGSSRSGSIDSIIRQADELASKGIKEVVLTGVNIGDFGRQAGRLINGQSFLDLIKALDRVEGIERYRISSIEPNLLSNEIIDFVAASQRFVPHFHIPLQSGCDETLKRMKRRYLSALYTDRVKQIKSRMPNAAIGVDVITGFPGETDEEFETSYGFINALDVSYLHVFTYSERPNTEAFDMPGKVDVKVRQERTQRLRMLSAKKQHLFYQSQIDSSHQVLWESENKKGLMFGFTENYIKTATEFDEMRCNKLEVVKITGIENGDWATSEITDEQLAAESI
jgi:threonylcarbamoyladenosine tRNA methylthiotransferase MtaB